ncbi:MAG: acyloxyacyl hydrolase [Duncaniella sp.]|nr:acyloxyacyl hydrolase [Duncaniella sp.]
MLRPLFLILLIASGALISSAETRRDSIVSSFEIGVHTGYALSSHPLMTPLMPEGTRPAHIASGAHLRYSVSGIGPERTRSVSQGIGLSATTFFRPKTVGTPVGLYLFQRAPIKIFSRRLMLTYEWNFGITTFWHKTSTLSDIRTNLIVGSPANAVITLSFPFVYKISPQVALLLAPEITHYSNGNTSWPNPGVNSLGINVGVLYTPAPISVPTVNPFASDPSFRRSFSVDLTLYGAWRKSYLPADGGSFTPEGEQLLLPGHFGVAGVMASPMWHLHPTFRTGPSLDLQWNGNSSLIPTPDGAERRFTRPCFLRQISAGISARAELVMPIFAINLGLGYGLLGPHATRTFYQMANLKISLPSSPVYLNIGYRFIRFRSPSNLMLGFGMTFPKR